MTSRATILGKIARTLGGAGAAGRREVARAHIDARARRLIPARTRDKSTDDLVALMRGFLEGQKATVLDCADIGDVPAAVTRYLRAHNLPARVRMGEDPVLAGLAWAAESSLVVERGAATTRDVVGISRALAAVAETGTLVLTSGADNPVTLTFLPDVHIVLVSRRDVVGAYEDAWDRLRAATGDGVPPRTVNLVSGPSRTADIASTIVNGAHGPKSLCVVLVP